MMTVHELSALSGVSIRTLQYYDEIGLLRPAKRTEAGYRLYDGQNLERLQQILLFRELEFPRKEILRILESPDFDRNKALEQQIALLTLKREHLDKLILLAKQIRQTGGNTMDFEAFDKKRLEEYAAQAKKAWGETAEYREFEAKNNGKTAEEQQETGERLMGLFAEFGSMKQKDPAAPEVRAQVKKLKLLFP